MTRFLNRFRLKKKGKTYYVPEELTKKLEKEPGMAPHIEEILRTEMRSRRKPLSSGLPDFTFIGERGAATFHGAGREAYNVVSRGSTTTKMYLAGRVFERKYSEMQKRFKTQQRAYDEKLPVVKPLAFRRCLYPEKVRRGGVLVWEEERYGDSLRKFLPKLESERELVKIVKAYKKAVELFAKKGFWASDRALWHNALYDESVGKIKFTDIGVIFPVKDKAALPSLVTQNFRTFYTFICRVCPVAQGPKAQRKLWRMLKE